MFAFFFVFCEPNRNDKIIVNEFMVTNGDGIRITQFFFSVKKNRANKKRKKCRHLSVNAAHQFLCLAAPSASTFHHFHKEKISIFCFLFNFELNVLQIANTSKPRYIEQKTKIE